MLVYDLVMVFGTALFLNGCSVMEFGNEYLPGIVRKNEINYSVAFGKCEHFKPQTSELLINFTQTVTNLTTSGVLNGVSNKRDFHQSIAPFEVEDDSFGSSILGAFHIQI